MPMKELADFLLQLKRHMGIKNQKGQSSIEFIMTFFMMFGFIFLFLKMANNYTEGYMVHHATYMASRAYLVFDSEKNDPQLDDETAFEHAQTVFKKYLPDVLFPDITIDNLRANHPGDVNHSALVGLYATFERKFSAGYINIKEPLIFRSEAFLGREPTRADSAIQVCAVMASIVGATAEECKAHMTLDDNGG